MFSYRSILKQALNIAWGYKYLWVFGLFAAIAAASGAYEYQFLINSFQVSALESSYFHLGIFLAILEAIGLFLIGLVRVFSYDFVTILNTLTAIIILFLLAASFIWLSITSQAALVFVSKKVIVAKKRLSEMPINDGLTEGHKHFWRVLALNVVIHVTIAIILSLISIPLIFMAERGSEYLAVIYTLGFIIFIPLAISLSLIVRYAIAFRVLENTGFYLSIKKAWQLFFKNWLISIEMGILLFFINFLAGFVILFSLGVLIWPYFIFALDYGFGLLAALLAGIALIIIILFGSFLTTFQISAWTGLFLELKNNRGEAKLERVFKKKTKKSKK